MRIYKLPWNRFGYLFFFLSFSFQPIINPLWLCEKEIIKYSKKIFWFYVNIMNFFRLNRCGKSQISLFRSVFRIWIFRMKFSNWFWITHFQLDRDKSFDWFSLLLLRNDEIYVHKGKSLICKRFAKIENDFNWILELIDFNFFNLFNLNHSKY